MHERRVIFVEGLFGSGKSTMTELLTRELEARGRDVRAWPEYADSHPIPLDPESERIEEEILAPDPLARVEAKWAAADLKGEDGVVILESRLLQHAAMYPLLADQPPTAIKAMLGRLYAELSALDPALVLFRHRDVAAHLEHVLADDERRSWLAVVSRLGSRLPWLQNRGLSGERGWRDFMLVWGHLLEELGEECPFRTLELLDAWRDRPESLTRALAFVD
jgi:hypothetical protein